MKKLSVYFVKSEKLKRQLKLGRNIEREHDDTVEKIAGKKLNKKKKVKYAEMIAKDHIAELSDYYDRLVKMEKEGKRESN